MARLHPTFAAALMLFLACSALPTSMCACPPARTHFVLFGEVHRSGAPVPDARVVVAAEMPSNGGSCSLERALELLHPDARTGSDGRFRAVVYSVHTPDVR